MGGGAPVGSSGGRRGRDRRASRRASFVAVPGLYCGETANGLWKYVRAGDIGVEEAVERLDSALALPDHIAPDRDVAPEALVAAATHAHPVYDMMYAVLARRFGCRVCTLDPRLAAALDDMKIARVLLGP